MISLPDFTPDNFSFFAEYVLSGFIIYLIRNAFVFGERPKVADIALDILLFSLVNQLVWRMVLSLTLSMVGLVWPDLLQRIAAATEMLFYLEVFALPILIGVVSGNALRKGWAKGLFRIVSIPIVDPIPRAYDHVFSQRGIGYVILSFQDGSKIYGYYGVQSRAGRDPGRSEIYLESLYVVGKDGQWVEAEPSRAALIQLSGLRMNEFLN